MTAATHESIVVGFVGVGQIGAPIADQISRKYTTILSNRSQGALDPFRGRCAIAATPADLAARADIVFACLPNAQSYRDVVCGEGGIASGGRARLFVNLGTTGFPTVLEIAEELGKQGIGVLDAPISGGPQRARSGELLSIVSGDESQLEFARPVIDCYSSKLVYLGSRLGAAQTMKLVNNLLVVSNMVLTAEAMVMGVKSGLDPEQMLEVLRSGTGQNYAATEIFPRFVFTRNFNFGGRLGMGAKDYACVLDEAASLGVPVPAAGAVQRILLTAIEDQGADADFSAIVKFIEKRAQTMFPKTRP